MSAFSLSCQILKNVSGRLANERNERIPLTHVLGCVAISGQGGKGGDEALNSLLKVSATLKIAIFPYLRFQRFQIDILESFL